ncbi:MAG: cysteine desulfurase [Christensenellaceae bacterium]|jgi:cysteine desulfurase|nr:cysteine desulfurase [Christensenellaceae bacterium]
MNNKSKNKGVYLDNAATTAVDPRVLKAMLPYFTKQFGNASSLHYYGRDALNAVDLAREKIASFLNAKTLEIYFTSCGSESDNWALRGRVYAPSKNKNKHIITTSIEHPAVLDTCRVLEKEGVKVDYLGVDHDGYVSLDDVKRVATPETTLISIMMANNEIGSIQPIAEIGEFSKELGVCFHTDAVQAAESEDLNVNNLNVDLLSLSAHKFHGPKGIGILYIRSGVELSRLITGGHQERNQRAGTTNTPLIIGMASALEIAVNERAEYISRLIPLRNYFIDRVLKEIPFCNLNGGLDRRLPNNINLSFDFIESESILISLDRAGIAVSSGSACSAASLEPSHVIIALGVGAEKAHSSLRVSLGRTTTIEELDYTIYVLKREIERLRGISPLFNVEKGVGSYV